MIEITPQNPTNTDNISVTVTGASGCLARSTELTDNNPVFTFTVDPGCNGGFLPLAYNITFQIGNLSEGGYTIIHNTGVMFTEQKSFTVINAVPPSNIPSLSLPGLIILSAILFFTGKHYFKIG